MHLKEIVKELSRRNSPAPRQSVSRLLQTYAQTYKRFTRVAPATFALIENNEDIKAAGGRQK